MVNFMNFTRLFQYMVMSCCLLVCSLQAQGKAPTNITSRSTLHFILIADTIDENIGESVKLDVKRIVEEVNNISRYTGMELKSSILQGSKANYKETARLLNNLRVGKDDAVFFYFSGHGYRTVEKGNNPWPDLNFAGYNMEGIDFSLIVEQLVKKQPRFILAVADSCNSYIESGWMTTYKAAKRKGFDDERIQKENYRQLFVFSNGLVMAAGAIPGEYSYALPNGSLFTEALVDSIHEEVLTAPTNDVSWKVLMQRAQEKSNYWVYLVTYEIDGVTRTGKAVVEQHPQWIYVEDISDVPTTLRLIGR